MKAGVGLRVAICLVASIFGFAMATVAFADDVTDARAICGHCDNAVVKVLAVIKATDGSENFEQTLETAGTVIDPSGLTVVSLTTLDPTSAVDADEENGITLQVTSVKLRTADKKEIPAEVVLRDKDLDLAFIRPLQKPASPLACVNLKNAAKVDMLDEIVVLTRLGKIADRTASVCIERVQAVVERPRRFYIVSLTSMGEELGSPVFTTDGKIVGIVVTRRTPGKSDDFGSAGLPVVMSAEDIASAAAQALSQPVKDSPKKIVAKPQTKPVPKKPSKTNRPAINKRVK